MFKLASNENLNFRFCWKFNLTSMLWYFTTMQSFKKFTVLELSSANPRGTADTQLFRRYQIIPHNFWGGGTKMKTFKNESKLHPLKINTVKVLLFLGYQFSWFSREDQFTKFGSHPKEISIYVYTENLKTTNSRIHELISSLIQ